VIYRDLLIRTCLVFLLRFPPDCVFMLIVRVVVTNNKN